MERLTRVLRTLSMVSVLLVSPLSAGADAHPRQGIDPGGGHPAMIQGYLDGRPVCILERGGERYARAGLCSSGPDLEMREVPRGRGGLPPGHPPLVPGRQGERPAVLRSI